MNAALRMLALACLLAVPLARAQSDYPAKSIYRLTAALTDQDGRARGLDVHRGHPVLVTMFYSDCQATCPLIVETLRATERQLPAAERAELRVLMVSFDAQNDTPQALRAMADARHVDTTRWTLARADEATVRKIAALLGVQYRRLPDGGFNHATVIALLSPEGEIEATTATLGSADPRLVALLRPGPG